MAGALERSGSTPTGTLRMELMQGLVKMAWGSSSNRGGSAPRAAPAGAGSPGAQQPEGDRSARGIKTLGSATASRSRIESIDSSRWSEAELGSEIAGGDVGLPSPREGAPPASISRGKSGGARDIFNMPYTEQVGVWVGGAVRASTARADERLECRKRLQAVAPILPGVSQSLPPASCSLLVVNPNKPACTCERMFPGANSCPTG